MAAENKKILLIEDEVDLRELYLMILEDDGYEVTTADDGKSGWELLKSGGYDLVLLDIMLPYMDGLEMLEKLAAENENKQPFNSIVLLTNLTQDQTIAKAVEYGIRGYMVKSDYDPDQFVVAVKEFFT